MFRDEHGYSGGQIHVCSKWSTVIFIIFIFYVSLCVMCVNACAFVYANMLRFVNGGHRTTCEFALSTMYVSGIKLRSSDLAANTLTLLSLRLTALLRGHRNLCFKWSV